MHSARQTATQKRRVVMYRVLRNHGENPSIPTQTIAQKSRSMKTVTAAAAIPCVCMCDERTKVPPDSREVSHVYPQSQAIGQRFTILHEKASAVRQRGILFH